MKDAAGTDTGSTPRPVSDVAFSPSVKAAQQRLGSRTVYARMEETRGWQSKITPDLAAFIAERDSFYLASASADGQPYIQHRGGPKGFLKVLDEATLGFADFKGNRQYITVGNLAENDKTFIFLMDYALRQRVKLWGRARVVEGDDALIDRLMDPGYRARPERAILFEIAAWDANCRQHIVPRYDETAVAEVTQKLTARIAELERQLAALRG